MKPAIQGLNLPGELYLDRKNGQRDPIRLCKQNGGWVWNVHCVPPLRVAKRSTPQNALRNWLNKHESAIQPASAEAARQLAKEWEAFPMLQPIRRTRSMPPREIQSMTSDSPVDGSPPRETPPSQSQPDPPIRRRLRGKTSNSGLPWQPLPASARQIHHMALRVNTPKGGLSRMDVGMRSMMC